MSKLSSSVGAMICIVLCFGSYVVGDLKLGFYSNSCPNAENSILHFVREHISNAPSLAAPLLRMHFHDCFVRGCDASVLINSTSSSPAEKAAAPNLSLRGFDFVDRVKNLVEEECPGVVSCADIIALVARDSVGVLGGPYWEVPTGRRDGLISNATEVLSNIPFPTFNFTALKQSFANKGLNVTDLLLLWGSHTIGVSRCSTISNRLFNFSGIGDEDPSLDRKYAVNLRNKCKVDNGNTSSTVEMDPGSSRTFDLGYYKNLFKRRGLFQSDAALITNPTTRDSIIDLVNSHPDKFFRQFALSMEKMGRINVKTGSLGEIRRTCAVVNS